MAFPRLLPPTLLGLFFLAGCSTPASPTPAETPTLSSLLGTWEWGEDFNVDVTMVVEEVDNDLIAFVRREIPAPEQFALSDGSMPLPISVSPRTLPERATSDITFEDGVLTMTFPTPGGTVVYQGKVEGKRIKGTMTWTITPRTPPPENKDTYWMRVPPRKVYDAPPKTVKWVAKRTK